MTSAESVCTPLGSQGAVTADRDLMDEECREQRASVKSIARRGSSAAEVYAMAPMKSVPTKTGDAAVRS